LITGYKVLIDDGLDGPFKIGYDGSANPSKLFAVVSGLIFRSTYKLKVFAINKAGAGAESEILTCYTVTIPD